MRKNGVYCTTIDRVLFVVIQTMVRIYKGHSLKDLSAKGIQPYIRYFNFYAAVTTIALFL